MVLEEFPLTVFGHVLIIAMYVVSEGRFTSSTCGYDVSIFMYVSSCTYLHVRIFLYVFSCKYLHVRIFMHVSSCTYLHVRIFMNVSVLSLSSFWTVPNICFQCSSDQAFFDALNNFPILHFQNFFLIIFSLDYSVCVFSHCHDFPYVCHLCSKTIIQYL